MGKRCEGHKDKSGPANLTCFCTWVQHVLRTREPTRHPDQVPDHRRSFERLCLCAGILDGVMNKPSPA